MRTDSKPDVGMNVCLLCLLCIRQAEVPATIRCLVQGSPTEWVCPCVRSYAIITLYTYQDLDVRGGPLYHRHHHHHISVMELGHLLNLSGVLMRNTIAYPTQQSSSHSRGIPCSHKRGNDDRVTSQRYNCFIRNGGNAIPKHAGPEDKVSSPTAGLTLLRARNSFWGNFNHWQFSRKKPESFSLND